VQAVSYPADEYMVEYMEDVLEIDEATVRAKLQDHAGDILLAERAIYVDKFGEFIARLMFS
jgi:hypothetical protein